MIVKDFIGRFFGEKSREKKNDGMSEEEKKIIMEFASGDESVRSKSLDIYYKYMGCLEERKTVFMRFMSEVESAFPDIGLKAKLREELNEMNEASEVGLKL